MNTKNLTDHEIALIQALVFYHPEGLSKQFDKLCCKICEQLNMHPSIGRFKVWG